MHVRSLLALSACLAAGALLFLLGVLSGRHFRGPLRLERTYTVRDGASTGLAGSPSVTGTWTLEAEGAGWAEGYLVSDTVDGMHLMDTRRAGIHIFDCDRDRRFDRMALRLADGVWLIDRDLDGSWDVTNREYSGSRMTSSNWGGARDTWKEAMKGQAEGTDERTR